MSPAWPITKHCTGQCIWPLMIHQRHRTSSTCFSKLLSMRLQIKKMTSYLRADKYKRYNEVPDPYFAAPGDQSGFDLVSSCGTAEDASAINY